MEPQTIKIGIFLTFGPVYPKFALGVIKNRYRVSLWDYSVETTTLFRPLFLAR